MELAALVSGVIKEDPKSCDFLPLNQVYIDGVRQNDKRSAWIKMAVPDGWVLNLRGNEKLTDGFIVMRIDRQFVEKFMKQQKEESDHGSRECGDERSGGSISGEAGEGGVSG